MSKRAEWERSRANEADDLQVGNVIAFARDGCQCGCNVGPRWSLRFDEEDGDADSLDHAKQLAEGKLRELHDALVEHFAPVLRWESHVATIGPWEIYARDRLWSVRIAASPGRYEFVSGSPRGYSGDAAQAERDAIAKLRALGVVFRTEGE